MYEKKNSEKLRLVEELHAPTRRNFPRRRIIVCGYNDLWQADLVDSYMRYDRIITTFTPLSMYKNVEVVPLKAKSESDVATAIAKIFQDDGRKICRSTEERNFTMQTCRNSLL